MTIPTYTFSIKSFLTTIILMKCKNPCNQSYRAKTWLCEKMSYNTTPTIALERIRVVKRNLSYVVRVVKYFWHSLGHKEVVRGKLENCNCTPIVWHLVFKVIETKKKTMVYLKSFCKTPIQDGGLNHVWVSTENSGYQCFFFDLLFDK